MSQVVSRPTNVPPNLAHLLLDESLLDEFPVRAGYCLELFHTGAESLSVVFAGTQNKVIVSEPELFQELAFVLPPRRCKIRKDDFRMSESRGIAYYVGDGTPEKAAMLEPIHILTRTLLHKLLAEKPVQFEWSTGRPGFVPAEIPVGEFARNIRAAIEGTAEQI